MATPLQIETLRRYVSEADDETFSDGDLGQYIDSLGLNGAAAEVWQQKAAAYSEMVNTSEGGASRALGDLYKNALAMSTSFRKRVQDETAVVTNANAPRVTKIVRM